MNIKRANEVIDKLERKYPTLVYISELRAVINALADEQAEQKCTSERCEHIWIGMYGTHDEIVRYDCANCKMSKPLESQGVQNDSCEVDELYFKIHCVVEDKQDAMALAKMLVKDGYSKRATNKQYHEGYRVGFDHGRESTLKTPADEGQITLPEIQELEEFLRTGKKLQGHYYVARSIILGGWRKSNPRQVSLEDINQALDYIKFPGINTPWHIYRDKLSKAILDLISGKKGKE